MHLAASGGGHLDLLLLVRDTFASYRRVWVTTPGPKADALRAEGERVVPVPRMDRRRVRPANPARSVRIALRERPQLVVTSGAGVVVTFALAARALGARLLFVETMARVTSSSLTGRVLAPVADAVFVQWPGLLGLSPQARLCKPMLLSEIAPAPAPDGEGTFVAVGSHDQAFDRLLRAVDAAAAAGVLPAPVTAQIGPSSFRSPRVATEPWLGPERFAERLDAARYVVCHGGAGIIAGALRAGRRPLVMSRRRAFGEHVDDHQGDLVRELDRDGLVVSVEGGISAAHLRAVDGPWPATVPWADRPDLRDALPATLEALRWRR